MHVFKLCGLFGDCANTNCAHRSQRRAHLDTAISQVASFRQERRIHPAGHLITRARCRMNAAFPSQCPGTPKVSRAHLGAPAPNWRLEAAITGTLGTVPLHVAAGLYEMNPLRRP